MDRAVTARIRDSLKAVERLQGEAPCIFIDGKGRYWLNGHAKRFISHKAIPLADFMEWLMIGASHLKNLSYGDVRVNMMHLPGNNVAVFLEQMEPGSGAKTALTVKEREVLRLVIRGLSNKRIAESMNISPQTVNVHLDHIYRKLGCSNRVAAGFMGLKNGLFLPPPH
ncbi:MAG: LuxR C-terminal-related transcriptional regulator [Nitrospiraceae bacterium]|nr:LuxR C-terminal-related transcriptional regulator [Nitrospiraceae bacterium]